MDRQAIMSREAPPTNLSAEQIEKADEAIREALGLAYDCMRVWEAWSYGTMGPDDFWPVAESDERVAEIRDAVLAAIGISIKADEAPDCAGAGHAKQQEAVLSAGPAPAAWTPEAKETLRKALSEALVGLRGCNSRHGGARKPEPCIYRMRTTDPGCTGCVERDEDQAAETGG